MTIDTFWTETVGEGLRQGDLLPRCFVPVVAPDFDQSKSNDAISVLEHDLIILTQSCDLESKKVRLVALSPVYPIRHFENANPNFKQKGAWENVRRGRVEGLHLLASPLSPEDNQLALVVDFREIFSLPFGNLTRHAAALGSRWRLESPYLEHFSQSFARFFMRVGLPSSIPPYSR